MMMRRFMRIFLLVFVCVYVAPKTLRCHRVNVNFESGRLPFGIARFRFGEIATKTGRNGTRSNSVPSFGHRFAAGVRTGPMHMSRRWSGSQHLLLGSASQQPRRFESMAVCNLMNLFWRNLFCLPRKLLILHRICCPAYRFIRKSSPIQCSNLCWPNSSRTNVAKSRRPHLDPKLCNFIRKIRSKMPKICWKLGSLFCSFWRPAAVSVPSEAIMNNNHFVPDQHASPAAAATTTTTTDQFHTPLSSINVTPMKSDDIPAVQVGVPKILLNDVNGNASSTLNLELGPFVSPTIDIFTSSPTDDDIFAMSPENRATFVKVSTAFIWRMQCHELMCIYFSIESSRNSG